MGADSVSRLQRRLPVVSGVRAARCTTPGFRSAVHHSGSSSTTKCEKAVTATSRIVLSRTARRPGRSAPWRASRRRRTAVRCVSGGDSVEAALGLVEPFRDEQLDGIGGPPDDRVDVVLGRERGEDVVGDRTRVAATRSPDADAQAEEVLRAEAPARSSGARCAPPGRRRAAPAAGPSRGRRRRGRRAPARGELVEARRPPESSAPDSFMYVSGLSSASFASPTRSVGEASAELPLERRRRAGARARRRPSSRRCAGRARARGRGSRDRRRADRARGSGLAPTEEAHGSTPRSLRSRPRPLPLGLALGCLALGPSPSAASASSSSSADPARHGARREHESRRVVEEA